MDRSIIQTALVGIFAANTVPGYKRETRYKDKDGLSSKDRKRITEIKDSQTYKEDEDPLCES